MPRFKRLAAVWLPFVAASGLALLFGARLSPYGLPGTLWMACVLALWTALLGFFDSVVRSWRTTEHRCTRAGCDFTVRLTGASAAESRRWQETAAAHPHVDTRA